MAHLTQGQQQNRHSVESKMTQHLQRVRKVFEDYELSCKMQLAQAFKKQDMKVSTIEQRVSEDLD